MISIRTFNKVQLGEFVNSEEFEHLEFLPVSRHRAISQIKNPRASADQILLFMAYENDKPVAYLGALPDFIFAAGDEYMECAWMSCIWVHEQQRGKQLAWKLVEACYKAWDKRILGAEFAEASGKLFDKTGIFDNLENKQGIRFHFRADLHNLLPPKRSFFKKIKGLLVTFDWMVNLILDVRFLFLKKASFNPERVTHIDDEASEFILKHQENELFRRSPRDLEWIIRNPWVIAGEENPMSRKYHFSSVDRSFDFFAYKLRNKDNKVIAFLLLSKRNGVLKLPYCYMEKGAEVAVKHCIEQLVISWKINSFLCFHPVLINVFGLTPLALVKRSFKRRYIISKDLKDKMHTDRRFIQDGDADTAFV